MSHTFNRQAMFTPEGRYTSIPSKLTEKPNLEQQAHFDTAIKTYTQVDQWLRNCNEKETGQ